MVARAVLGRIADEGDFRVAELAHAVQVILKAVQVCLREQLLAVLHHRRIIGILAAVLTVVSLPVEFRREGLHKVQQRDEALAVERALAGLPVDERGEVVGDTVAHDSGPRGVIVKDVGVLLQLGHRVLHGRDIPHVIAIHDLRKAECGLDHEARGQLVELAIGLAGLNDLGDEALARQLGVAVDQLVEVGQDALGRVALDGQILGQEHVGDDAGHDLGVQLGEARAVIVVRVELGIVLDHDAVGIARLVEVDDLLLDVIVQIEAGERQDGLFREARGVHALHQHELVDARLRLVVPVVQDGDDAAVVHHGKAAHVVRVDVAVHPVEQLFRGVARRDVAEDLAVVVVEEVIFLDTGIDVPRAVGQRGLVLGVIRLCLDVDRHEIVRAGLVLGVVDVGDRANGVRVEAFQLAAVVSGLDRREIFALAVEQVDVLPVIAVDRPILADHDGGDVGIIARRHVVRHDVAAAGGADHRVGRGCAVRRFVLRRDQVEAGQFLARAVEMHHGGAVLIDLILPFVLCIRIKIVGQLGLILIDKAENPDAAVVHDLEVVDVAAALPALFDGRERQALHLSADLAVQIERIERRPVIGICIGVGLFLAVFVGVGVGLGLLPVGDAGCEPDRAALGRHARHAVHLGGYGQIRRLVGIFRRHLRLVVLCRRDNAGVSIAGVTVTIIFLAAAGQHADQQHEHQKQGKNTMFHSQFPFCGRTAHNDCFVVPIISGFFRMRSPSPDF